MLKKICFIFAVCIFPGCSPDSTSLVTTPTNPYAVFFPMIEDVREKVQTVRQLRFIKPVKVGFLTRKEYGNEFTDRQRFYEAYTVLLKQLCLIPDSLKNISPYMKDYYTGFPAAYYLSGTDSITFVDPADYDTILLKELIAHEFTHALQDQHFNIDFDVSIPYRSTSNFNSDYYMARRCLFEGDAFFSEISYLKSIDQFFTNIQTYFLNKRNFYFDSLSLYAAPQFLRIKGLFPYKAGALFVAKAQLTYGWKTVDSLYHANRVLSTAEILTGEAFEPVTFDASTLIKTWYANCINVKLADDDNYGPVWLMEVLRKYIDRTSCSEAFGWRGDRFIYMLNDDNVWGKFVWALKFKSDENAISIFKSIDQLLASRVLGGEASRRVEVNADSLIQFTTGSVNTSLIRCGSYLFWVENVDNPTTVALSMVSNVLAKRTGNGEGSLRLALNPDLTRLKKQLIDNSVEDCIRYDAFH
jgi:hypothetical protein